MTREEKEAFLLRLALTQRTVAHQRLHDELKQEYPDEDTWKEFLARHASLLMLYAQSWTMREQHQFERSLKPGDHVRVFWTEKENNYTARGVYQGTAGVRNQWADVSLLEDVSEAEKKRGDEVRVPFATFVQKFYLRKNSLYPLREKELL